MTNKLSHIDERGDARMVDVSDKAVTERIAVARGRLNVAPQTLAMIKDGTTPKGDVLATARIAGIMAAKKTSDLIPMCHPLLLSSVKVELTLQDDPAGIEIEARVKLSGQTGVEMEALTAVSIAALTLYDMLKAVDKSMSIGDIRLVEKTGGRSGDYKAS